MSHESVLAALPNSKDEAKSLKDIAQSIGLATSKHTDWIRAERSLARVLRILIKWGWVARDKRQSDDGHRFWYNVYWKTELAIQQEADRRY
jgi:predicted transcriptional regulator